MGRPVIESAATIIPVRDIGRSVEFYVTVLGFQAGFIAGDGSFARVSRDTAVIQLIHSEDIDALEATAHAIAIHLSVDGVDALYLSLRAELDRLAASRVRPPFDDPHGLREFHVRDPDGCLLRTCGCGDQRSPRLAQSSFSGGAAIVAPAGVTGIVELEQRHQLGEMG
eukprot:gene46048-62370_t